MRHRVGIQLLTITAQREQFGDSGGHRGDHPKAAMEDILGLQHEVHRLDLPVLVYGAKSARDDFQPITDGSPFQRPRQVAGLSASRARDLSKSFYLELAGIDDPCIIGHEWSDRLVRLHRHGEHHKDSGNRTKRTAGGGSRRRDQRKAQPQLGMALYEEENERDGNSFLPVFVPRAAELSLTHS